MSCEPVCVCVSLVRVVIICLASTYTALVSSPSLAVLHLSTTYLPTVYAYGTVLRVCTRFERVRDVLTNVPVLVRGTGHAADYTLFVPHAP